jgi:hypothetical protein
MGRLDIVIGNRKEGSGGTGRGVHTVMILLMSEKAWQFQSWRYYEETKTPWT